MTLLSAFGGGLFIIPLILLIISGYNFYNFKKSNVNKFLAIVLFLAAAGVAYLMYLDK